MILNYYLDQPYRTDITKQEKAFTAEQIQDLKANRKPIPDKLLNEYYNNKETAIYLFAQVGQVRVKVKTGLRALPKYWDFDAQEVKKSVTSHNQFNLALNKLKSDVTTKYLNLYNTQEGISTQELKELIVDLIAKKEPKDTRRDFYDAFDHFLIAKSNASTATIKKYNTLLKILKHFEVSNSYSISFSSINLRFYDLFKSFLIKERKHTNNTIEKYTSTLKTFMHFATDREFNTSSKDFIKFKAAPEKVDIVCLTEEELMLIYNFDFSKNKTYDKVRDAYCFSSFTGQRYSDLENLKWDDIKGNRWQLRTKKTKENINVFLINKALEILNKYKGKEKPLEIISNQKSNKYIKEICKIVGIDEPFTKTQYRGSQEIVRKEPKYNFISFHSGRRNFCTISLSKGISSEVIMKITGHKDYRVFKKYVGLADKVVEEQFSHAWN
jgi:integrase